MDTRWAPAEAMLKERNLDVRATHYRFMDQKVTPDVLHFIAGCVLNLPEIDQSHFTKDTIWKSEYFKKNVPIVFGKPRVDLESAANEYDKFISQPLKALSYAGVLSEEKVGGRNWYGVLNLAVLEIIAQDTRLALEFLALYNEAVLRASGMGPALDGYRNGDHSEESYSVFRNKFILFMLGATMIGTRGSSGAVEIGRILPKVMNPIAVLWGIPGSVRGHVSRWNMSLPDLVYNQTNFRDARSGKHKSQTRAEAQKKAAAVVKYRSYETKSAMDSVRRRHAPQSEVLSGASGAATEVHHIFPQSQYRDLASVTENLILLTSSQHHVLAHPQGKHQMIDREYQRVCLIAKLDSLEGSMMANDGFYSKARMVWLLNTALNLDLHPDDSLANIRLAVRSYSYN